MMKKGKLKKPKVEKVKKEKARRERIDPDHFTVFELRTGWEERISKYWSQEEINFFKERQELQYPKYRQN